MITAAGITGNDGELLPCPSVKKYCEDAGTRADLLKYRAWMGTEQESRHSLTHRRVCVRVWGGEELQLKSCQLIY